MYMGLFWNTCHWSFLTYWFVRQRIRKIQRSSLLDFCWRIWSLLIYMVLLYYYIWVSFDIHVTGLFWHIWVSFDIYESLLTYTSLGSFWHIAPFDRALAKRNGTKLSSASLVCRPLSIYLGLFGQICKKKKHAKRNGAFLIYIWGSIDSCVNPKEDKSSITAHSSLWKMLRRSSTEH